MIRALVGAVILLAGSVFGQSPESKPSFTSADVKASKPGMMGGGSGFMGGGQFVARGSTLLDLIHTAFDVDVELISGGPMWLDSDRFDITTKVPEGTSREAAQIGRAS